MRNEKWKTRVRGMVIFEMPNRILDVREWAQADIQYGPGVARDVAEGQGQKYPGFSACCAELSEFWRNSPMNTDLYWLVDEEDVTTLRPEGDWEECEIDEDNPEGEMYRLPPEYVEIDSTEVHQAVWLELAHYVKG